jgi:hypothetical protein
MTHRNPNIPFYTILVGLFCLSFGYNIHLYNKIQVLESSLTLTRCGTSEYELMKIKQEIKRLEFNQDNTKSVLIK